ncbi:hypoxanthine phosphoribosyltransferase [Proteiniborus ethanoligenes]|uniref:Hypoxanthine phosphoribosyltransferase n=1 Tax=Proteiniborus ethanoligenes TaxID=415015 RepID=A0A1H3SIE9_9FIRM|nr:hypoxanthine phosphoribosyltransferase [Proteiniborus ethanoligenes]TAH63498.1 MAG: hypoxanthine phosphoribosyltransferase [Gottschalkiaceae bacterium]SDZ37468.1 hypoxanthine phosphoribosyltransferase [Proteiniborus ethanoligenes]
MEMNKKQRVLFSADDISKKVKELGQIISADYEGKELVVVSLLRGSFIFASDLVREINVLTQIEFMTTASYGHGEETSGQVNIVTDIKDDITGKDVLVVDDIMDTGLTMEKILEHLKQKNPNSIKSCVMLDKPERRKTHITPDYVGFTIPDVFIVGYGLNYGDYYRNIPYIFTFDE